MPPLELRLDDVVRLKRPHPCGGYDWRVTRLGADIGLVCLTCHRRVLLERPTLEKRLKQFVSHAPPAPEPELTSGLSPGGGTAPSDV
jgi:hypothetical protein